MGATRNIGRSIALSLAAGGAAIAVNARTSREDGEKIMRETNAQCRERAGANPFVHSQFYASIMPAYLP